MMESQRTSRLPAPSPTRRERFFAGYLWLVLKNVIGWTLILLSLVAGPLVPGPGGIPLFLIGFALASFPGKRKLTARVLRGRPLRRGLVLLATLAVIALILPALGLRLLSSRFEWLDRFYQQGPLSMAASYAIGVLLVAAAICAALALVNLLLRIMPAIRRRVRPWLRHHRIRLLPPRWRVRHPHEQGAGPLRLRDEILSLVKRHHLGLPGRK